MGEGNQRGGFIWHTTGSGKTMTSFKSAQLIANSKDADKWFFLLIGSNSELSHILNTIILLMTAKAYRNGKYLMFLSQS